MSACSSCSAWHRKNH